MNTNLIRDTRVELAQDRIPAAGLTTFIPGTTQRVAAPLPPAGTGGPLPPPPKPQRRSAPVAVVTPAVVPGSVSPPVAPGMTSWERKYGRGPGANAFVPVAPVAQVVAPGMTSRERKYGRGPGARSSAQAGVAETPIYTPPHMSTQFEDGAVVPGVPVVPEGVGVPTTEPVAVGIAPEDMSGDGEGGVQYEALIPGLAGSPISNLPTGGAAERGRLIKKYERLRSRRNATAGFNSAKTALYDAQLAEIEALITGTVVAQAASELRTGKTALAEELFNNWAAIAGTDTKIRLVPVYAEDGRVTDYYVWRSDNGGEFVRSNETMTVANLQDYIEKTSSVDITRTRLAAAAKVFAVHSLEKLKINGKLAVSAVEGNYQLALEMLKTRGLMRDDDGNILWSMGGKIYFSASEELPVPNGDDGEMYRIQKPAVEVTKR